MLWIIRGSNSEGEAFLELAVESSPGDAEYILLPTRRRARLFLSDVQAGGRCQAVILWTPRWREVATCCLFILN